jgi:hypothetical protein
MPEAKTKAAERKRLLQELAELEEQDSDDVIDVGPAPAPVRSQQQVSRKAADAVVDHFVGDKASPAVKQAAAEVIAPWAEKLVRGLDDFIKIPGTKWGIGLDPIIGMIVPGAGDAITGVGSMSLLFLAFKERTPTVIKARIVMNILVDTLGGLLPFVGDAFDLVWRSNKRNLELIETYREDPKLEPTWKDYALVALGLVLAVASIVLPIVMIYVIGFSVFALLGALFGIGGE